MKRIHHSLSLVPVILLLSACGGGSSSGGGDGGQDSVACEITGPSQFTTSNSSLETTASYTIENTGTVPHTLETMAVAVNSSSGAISVNGNLQNSGITETEYQPGDIAIANLLWTATCTAPATAVLSLSALHSSSVGAQNCSLDVQFSCTD